ncbi:MAG TPA: sporulation protein [Firmicutes bacterium]|nr:sporulation protein [Bacillota bacterium]
MKNIMKCVLLVLFLIILLVFPAPIIESVKLGLNTWVQKVIPALFPFFVLTRLMIHFQLPQMIGKVLSPIFKHLLKMSPITFFIILISLISGNPSGPKMAKEYYEKNLITEREARGILYFCNFASPLFIIGTIGVVLYHSTTIGYLMLCAHFLSSLIIFLFCYRYFKTDSNRKIEIVFPNQSFAEILIDCIENSIQTLLRVGGIIVFYYILTTILEVIHVIPVLDASVLPLLANETLPTTEPLVAGFFEFVQGVIKLADTPMTLQIQLALTAFYVSFAGLSVHTQTFMFSSGIHANYFHYFVLRVVHGVASFVFVMVAYPFFMSGNEDVYLPVFAPMINPYEPYIQITMLLIMIYFIVKLTRGFSRGKKTYRQLPMS